MHFSFLSIQLPVTFFFSWYFININVSITCVLNLSGKANKNTLAEGVGQRGGAQVIYARQIAAY